MDVEHQRLLALVDTQKQHITELKQQLQETLEVQKRQQLQLVQASPARKGVRRLLEQAAADNTVLANRVEELRGQRNALIATKAALTAQVSELIRMAADSRQREEQHAQLLHQLAHLCRLIQQPHRLQPEEQMAAVVAHVRQLHQELQGLTEKLEAAARSGSKTCSPSKQRTHSAAADAEDAAPDIPAAGGVPCSPTGLRLDQRATSQLIWTSGPFVGQPQQQPDKQEQRDSKQRAAGNTQAAAAAACVSADGSFNTAHSQLLDMSPLRGVAATTGSSLSISNKQHTAGGDTTPQSKTPATVKLTGLLAAAGGTAGGLGVADAAGTPLSAQSLSAFSGGSGLHGPKPMQLMSPLRRCALQRLASTPRGSQASAAAAAAVGGTCSAAGTPSSCSSSNGDSAARPDLHTPQSNALGGFPSPVTCGGFGSSASVASSSSGSSSKAQHTVGLVLQPEFRLAAADGLWPSPAAQRASSRTTRLGGADVAGSAGGGISSHALWLLPEVVDAEDADGDDDVVVGPRSGRGVLPAVVRAGALCLALAAAAAGGAAAAAGKHAQASEAMQQWAELVRHAASTAAVRVGAGVRHLRVPRVKAADGPADAL